ncbi:SLC13 family permease [Arthrobacter sp. K5]|uniref:SLC13 family permease n=1 Tax=Arthrobacter sp. K5 TaxID=2839623 RepID=A0AAU8EYH7_9MICC
MHSRAPHLLNLACSDRREPRCGILCFAFGAVLTLLDPATSKTAITKIDWPTILLVGGVITYVGVLEHMGAIELIGHFAEAAGTPLLSAFALCVAAGLISAFASTTGMLAAIIPLSLPLVATGGIPGWAIITALAICSALVDLSPYSTVGATVIATAPESERARMTSRLMRWGMSMVIIGPVALVGLLVLPGTL